ncbi:MAG: aldo/keto reductase, partial [Fimbriimonadaceae bacterium]|nr:aldo/keto reductase [Alphaproteobacteria bacterium]
GTLEAKDLRRQMPRFEPEIYARNLRLLDGFGRIAEQTGCSMAQLALAWILARGDHIIALPGTKNVAHLAENAGADAVRISPENMTRIDALINQNTVTGPRYKAETQAEIDTEEFA